MNSSASRRSDLRDFPTQTLISRHSSFLPIPLSSLQSTELLPSQSMTVSFNGPRLKDFSASPSSFCTPLEKIMQNSSSKPTFLDTNNSRHANILIISHSSDHRLSVGTNIFESSQKGSSSPTKLAIHKHKLSFLKSEKDGQFSLRDQLKQTEQADQSFFTERSMLLPRIPQRIKKVSNFLNELVQNPATNDAISDSYELFSPTKRPTKLNPLQITNPAGTQKYEEDILKDWLVGKGDINMEPISVNQIHSDSIQDNLSSPNQALSPTIKLTKRSYIPPALFGLSSSRKRQYKSPDINNQNNHSSSSFSLLNNSPSPKKQAIEIFPEIWELPITAKNIENQEQTVTNNEIPLQSSESAGETKSTYLQAPLSPVKKANIDLFGSQRGSVSKPPRSKLELWMGNSGKQQRDQLSDSLNLSKMLSPCSNDCTPIFQKHLKVRDSFDQVQQLQSLGDPSQELLDQSQNKEYNDMELYMQEAAKQQVNDQNAQKNFNQLSPEIVLKSPHFSPFSSSPQKHIRFPRVHDSYNYSANYDKLSQPKYPSDIEESNDLINNRNNNSQILPKMNGDYISNNTPNSQQGLTNSQSVSSLNKPLKNASPLKIKSTGNISLLNASERLILNQNKSEQIIANSAQEQHNWNITNITEFNVPSITNFESISSNISGNQSPIPAFFQQTSEKNKSESPEKKPRYMKQNLRQLFPEKETKPSTTNQQIQVVKLIDSTVSPQQTARIIPSLQPISALLRQQRGVLKNRELDTQQEPEKQTLSTINETQKYNNLSDSLIQKRTLIRTKQYQQKHNDCSPSNLSSSLSACQLRSNGRKRVSFQERILIVDIKTSQSTYGRLARKDEGEIN